MSIDLKYKSPKFLIRYIFLMVFFLTILTSQTFSAGDVFDKTGSLWYPYLEWELHNSTYSGNPFDLVAWVTFTHAETGDTIRTQMFFDGEDRWKFRLTGTRLGVWNYSTSSQDSDLSNRQGSIIINPNPNPDAFGFITGEKNRWARNRGAISEVFTPQLVMYVSGEGGKFFNLDEEQLCADIQEFILNHGFNGFHVPVMVPDVWMTGSSGNADPRISTFEKLEMIITKTHQAGGMVHLWIWGDEERNYTPKRFDGGKNGMVDKRLQRYIAARLGPLPGWSAGYGFDNWEWNNKSDQEKWYNYMHEHMGWPHMLGARWEKNKLTQATNILDYAGYEQHRPDYDQYVKTIDMTPDRPSFSEDRFRIRQGKYEYKDYNEEMTRRGLWHSAMAGGVANIWGDLTGLVSHVDGSRSYSNREQIKTYSVFFNDKKRFLKNMERDNSLSNNSNTRVLRRKNNRYVFFREDADSLHMNLSGMTFSQPAVAVDTKLAYEEIFIGMLSPDNHVWQAPYVSDWAIAVGNFDISVLDTRQKIVFSGLCRIFAHILGSRESACSLFVPSGAIQNTVTEAARQGNEYPVHIR